MYKCCCCFSTDFPSFLTLGSYCLNKKISKKTMHLPAGYNSLFQLCKLKNEKKNPFCFKSDKTTGQTWAEHWNKYDTYAFHYIYNTVYLQGKSLEKWVPSESMVLMDRCPVQISGSAKTNGLLYMQHIQRMGKDWWSLSLRKPPAWCAQIPP